MEIVDIFKIVVPVILALCGTVWGTMSWTYTSDRKSQKEYWEAVHASLSKTIADHRTEQLSWQGIWAHRWSELDREFNGLRVKVAEEYVKREDWLDQAKSVERKVDLLRTEISKELQQLTKEVAHLGGAA